MRHVGSFLAGWKGLGRFWIGLLIFLSIAAGLLQALGPPSRITLASKEPIAQAVPPPTVASGPDLNGHVALHPPLHPGRPGRDTPGPIADPDPSLLDTYPNDPDRKLPRIAADGRVPMAAYAAGFDPTSMRPKVGMLIAGLGMSEADSLAAIKDLRGGVTLAFSPYAPDIRHLLETARMTEHEYLLAIPMEPQGYPVNDPDDRHALMTSLPPAENLNRLRWVLAQLTGYVGITNALGPMRGERLAAVSDQFAPVLNEAAQRGLLFVDARIAQPTLPRAWNRSVDVAIDDDPVDASALDQKLDLLTHTALDKGTALGIVWIPRPMTLSRVAAWTNSLAAKGLALAPVSALVLPPAKQEATK